MLINGNGMGPNLWFSQARKNGVFVGNQHTLVGIHAAISMVTIQPSEVVVIRKPTNNMVIHHLWTHPCVLVAS